MSLVSVHGPNTMYTTEGGGQAIASSPAGATATENPTNGLIFDFAFPSPGARPAADFDWSFTGPGSPAAQPNLYSGSVTFTGAGAVTIICTVAAGAGPPAAGAYTISGTATAGVPRSLPPGEEGEEEPDGEPFDPSAFTVQEVKDYVEANPDEADEILEAEEVGSNRVTLVTWLEQFIATRDQ